MSPDEIKYPRLYQLYKGSIGHNKIKDFAEYLELAKEDFGLELDVIEAITAAVRSGLGVY